MMVLFFKKKKYEGGGKGGPQKKKGKMTIRSARLIDSLVVLAEIDLECVHIYRGAAAAAGASPDNTAI